jgi:hypothetical protein
VYGFGYLLFQNLNSEDIGRENIKQLGVSDDEQETTNTPSWCLGIILLTNKIYKVFRYSRFFYKIVYISRYFVDNFQILSAK